MNKKLSNVFERKELFFVIKFFIIFFALSLILEIIEFSLLQELLASITGNILGLKVIGNQIIISAHNSFIVNNYCTGLLSASIFLAIIFSFKKPDIKSKALIAVIGIILLFLINIIRVYFVVWIGILNFDLAEIIHVITWFIMSGAIIFFWYYLTTRITKEKNLEKFL